MLTLYKHQQDCLNQTADKTKVAYYLDMGLGKTFTGSEKMKQLDTRLNLVICQKSKVDDWVEHFEKHYRVKVYDLTVPKQFSEFHGIALGERFNVVGIINYDLVFRRKELLELSNFTLMLDESSLIQNENTKRSKFIMKLQYTNLILLSGTPTGGKYEKLWSQLNMLGYDISKKAFYNMYVNYHYDNQEGFPIMIIDGYKNVDRLKKKMHQHGCVFMKSDEVFDLPQQNFIDLRINTIKEYRKFRKDCICQVDGVELVGDTTLTKMLYERQLCGMYNNDKINAFIDLLESTNDRLIVFYNFNHELELLKSAAWEYTQNISEVNGSFKDLTAYGMFDDSVTFIQYQAGAMGLNLQKANKIVYYSPPTSSELYEQSKKRIHRIGQEKPCFYYRLICKNSIEERIYKTLEMRRDFTDKLFERGLI